MSKVELKCEICGKVFLRYKSEANRNKKKGRKVCCSLRCVGKSCEHHLALVRKTHPENLANACKKDEFSPFRLYMKRIKSNYRGNGKKSNHITLQDLKEQWDKQEGKCPYTGWVLKTPSDLRKHMEKTPDRASLDRIDSSKPYTKENIQFVSMIAQYAKNSWPKEEVFNFCKAVVKHHDRKKSSQVIVGSGIRKSMDGVCA